MKNFSNQCVCVRLCMSAHTGTHTHTLSYFHPTLSILDENCSASKVSQNQLKENVVEKAEKRSLSIIISSSTVCRVHSQFYRLVCVEQSSSSVLVLCRVRCLCVGCRFRSLYIDLNIHICINICSIYTHTPFNWYCTLLTQLSQIQVLHRYIFYSVSQSENRDSVECRRDKGRGRGLMGICHTRARSYLRFTCVLFI